MATANSEGNCGVSDRKEGRKVVAAPKFKKESLVVAHWNLGSLRNEGREISAILKPKLAFLQEYMEDNGIDVLGLSETHVFHPDNEPGTQRLFNDRFCLYLSNKSNESVDSNASRLDRSIQRTSRDGPGVGILVRKRPGFQYDELVSPDPARIIAFVLEAPPGSTTKGILIIEAYAPSDRLKPTNADDRKDAELCDEYVLFKKEYNAVFYDNLQALFNYARPRRNGISDVILMGDFNANINTGIRPGFPDDAFDNASLLLTFCERNNLTIVHPATKGLNYIILRTTKDLRLSVTQFKSEKPPYKGPKSSPHALISANVVFDVENSGAEDSLNSGLQAMKISDKV